MEELKYPAAYAGLSHALALSSQTGVPVGDIIILPVVPEQPSAESFHPHGSAGKSNDVECSLTSFQRVHGLAGERV